MKAKLIRHDKITNECGNTVEIRMWSVPKTADKPYGFKCFLVYIVNGEREQSATTMPSRKATTDITENGKSLICL